MTHNKNDDEQYQNVDWIARDGDGKVQRRTIVQGAAWTIPVVALASATPAAAASATPTLAFTQSSYSGTACGTITGVKVLRTTDGTTPDPGKPVTVTLSGGYTFPGGATTYTGTTGSDGTVLLPAISVPAVGGSSTFAATSDALTATAPVDAPKTGTAKQGTAGANTATFGTIPPGATALGGGYFLSGTTLYYKTTVIATNVSAANAEYSTGNVVDYIEGGVGKQALNGTVNGTYGTLPAGATPVGGGYFLSGTTLFYKNTVFATNVSSATGEYGASGNLADYVQGGVGKQALNGTVNGTYGTLPAGATSLGGGYFLSGTTLYYKTTAIATNVSSAKAEYSPSGNIVDYVQGGVGKQALNGTLNSTYGTLPAGATAIGGGYFLSGTTLYYKTTAIATNVGSAAGAYAENNTNVVDYVESSSCA